MDWSKLPDILAVGLLATAFASAARRSFTHVSGIWLTGWLLIVAHFVSDIFLPAPGLWGLIANLMGIATLTWAGLLFMWAAVPYRGESSSRWMLLVLVASNTIYLCALVDAAPPWVLNVAAILIGAGPAAVMLTSIRRFHHPLRWAIILLCACLSAFLLMVQQRPNIGPDLAMEGILFTVYFGCCLHFWYMYRRPTAGAFITISAFLLWSLVFVIGPLMDAFFPQVHVESEVWNLPKYLVGVGMILLLLEEQIEHNKHLALHDVLTGLPNRRLFQDRLANTLERARRTGTQAALLVLDLDRFKQVNDTMGHHMGDLVLQRVATAFSARIRKSDTVARTGGDEFSVILEGPTNSDEAHYVGRSLQDLLEDPLTVEGRTVKIGVSFGIAIFPDDATDMDSLCNSADLRMYENKRTGLESEDSYDPPPEHPTGTFKTTGNQGTIEMHL